MSLRTLAEKLDQHYESGLRLRSHSPAGLPRQHSLDILLQPLCIITSLYYEPIEAIVSGHVCRDESSIYFNPDERMSDPIDEPVKQAADEFDDQSPDKQGQHAGESDSGDLEDSDCTIPK
jgi:hypothetical protein